MVTESCGTRFRATFLQSRWPGTAPSENANIIRDAEVNRRGEAEELRDDADEEQASAQFWLIDAAQIDGTTMPSVLDCDAVFGMAKVTASSRIQPNTAETTTDMYMPTAAGGTPARVSSAMCAEASKPVIVYCESRSPRPKTTSEAG